MNQQFVSVLAGLFFAFATVSLPAKTVYVDGVNGSDANDGLSAGTALFTLQAAVDLAESGDEVLAAPGVYDRGGRIAVSEDMGTDPVTNRVCIEKSLTLRASDGPALTFIAGAPDAASSNGLGPAAVRCLAVKTYEATVWVDGFTLTNGFTDADTDWSAKGQGGGAYLNYMSTLTNCLIVGNAASLGGGVANGTLRRCRVQANRAGQEGGGVYESTAYNTLIVGNTAALEGGGGLYGSYYHCTVVGNAAATAGGIQWQSQCYDTIIYYNQAARYPNYNNANGLYNCCIWPAPSYGEAIFVDAEPHFADTNGWSDLHLTGDSLCIDTGCTYGDMPAEDLDANPRVSGSQTDIGAFEWQGAVMPIVTLDAEQSELAEDAGDWTLTLTSSEPMTNNVSFAFSYSGTATRDADYTGAPDTVTISNGETFAQIVLHLEDDTQPEYPEALIVALVHQSGFRFLSDERTLSLLDNDGMPAVSRFYLNNGAGGTSTNLLTEFDIAVTNDPTEYVISEDPAFAGTEWTAAPGDKDTFTFTLSDGYGEKTVWFKVRKPDGAGGYLVSLPVSDSIFYGPPLSVALDQPDMTFTTGGETESAVWFGRSDPHATNGAFACSSPLPPDTTWVNSWLETSFTLENNMFFRFDYAQVGDGNMDLTIDGNYIYGPYFVPWETGQHTFEMELAAGEHTVRWIAYTYAPAEGGDTPGYSRVDNLSFAVPPPRVSFVTDAQFVAENSGTATVSLTREEPADAPLTVFFTADGTATAGSDYTLSTPGSVTFSAGCTLTNFTVAITDDTDPEHSETAFFSLTSGSGYRIGTTGQHVLTVMANDGLIDFYELILENGALETTNRLIRIDGTASETPAEVIASENADFADSEWSAYTPGDMFFTLSEGAGAKTVYAKVRIPKDGGGWEESDALSASIRFVDCTLQDALDTDQVITTQEATRWFGQRGVSHDGRDAAQSAPVGSYSYSEMSTVVEGPARVSFWWDIWAYYYSYLYIRLDDSTIDTKSGQYSDSGWSKSEYTIPAGTHTISWQYYQGYYTAGSNCVWVDSLQVRPDWPEASFENNATSVSESEGSVSFRVLLDRTETNTVTVPYTLGGTATQGSDYTVSPADSVSFAPGETEAWITVTLLDDTIPEHSETILLSLAPTTGVLAGEPSTSTVTITSNDGAPVVAAFGLLDGTSATTNQNVVMSLVYANSPTEYRISEDAAFDSADWQPIGNTPAFVLSEGFGVKTLWVQVRKPLDGGGFVDSDPFSCSVTLNPGLAPALGIEDVETGGSSPWFGQTLTSLDGAAGQSGETSSYYGTSWARATLTGSGTVSFKWLLSSGYYHSLYLLADGIQVASLSTSGSWLQQSYTFDSPGTHTIEWQFYSYYPSTWYDMHGWVDQVDLSGWTFPAVDTPVFSPETGTLFSETQDITLSCATPGATIRYTLDNSEPTASSTLYTAPFTLTETATIKAKAFKANYPDSATAQASYVKSSATPIFTPPSGTSFIGSLDVTITSAVDTVSIRYTLDGSEPSSSNTLYTGPVTLVTNTTISARAFNGDTPASATAQATYALEIVAAPAFTPESGLMFDGSGEVAIGCATAGATIRYTLDGSEPTSESPPYAVPLMCTNAMTSIRARAFAVGMEPGPTALGVFFRRGAIHAWGYDGYGQLAVPADLTNAVATAFGTAHALALRADSTVTAWGDNSYGRCDVPSGLSNVVAIAAGSSHSVALCADGTVVAWGYNGNGQTSTPSDLTNAVAIAAGGQHTAALRADGTVVAWGYNGNGQLAVPAGAYTAIAAGSDHTVALRTDGTVVAVGYNGYGQCNVPSDLSNVVAVTASAYHAAALRTDGTVAAWGYNWNGQCNAPADLSNAVAIAAGIYHTAALRADGTVAVWGDNGNGQCDIPEGLQHAAALASGDYTLGVIFEDVTPVRATPASGYWIPPGAGTLDVRLAAALAGGVIRYTTDGSDPTAASALYDGDLSFADPATLKARVFVGTTPAGAVLTARYVKQSATPYATPDSRSQFIAPGGTLEVALACDESGAVIRYTTDGSDPTATNAVYTAALTFDRPVWLKAKAFTPDRTPSRTFAAHYTFDGALDAWGDNNYGQCDVPAMSADTAAIAASDYHSVALRTNGTVVAWGYNGYGQCSIPSGLSNAVAVAAGTYHTAALRADGTVAAWGYNGNGQCNTPADLSNAVAIAAGTYHTAALRADGSVAVWGDNGNGQCDVPSDLSNAVAVAAGTYHTVALRADGTVAAWGYNGYGQCNVPSGLSNIVAVAAGYYHTVALRADGTVVAWGYSDYGQCDVPSGLSNAVAVAAGYYHTVALRVDGTIAAWGYDSYGQRAVPAGLPPVARIAAGGYHTLVSYGWPTPLVATPPSGYWIPAAAGTLTVRLTGAVGDAVVRYTATGAEPTASDTVTDGRLTLSATTLLHARAFAGTEPFGAVLRAVYSKRVSTPSVSPQPAAQFIPESGTLTVTLSCSDSGATIRYTTDKSDPVESSPPYVAPLQIGQKTTIKARAFKVGLIPSATAIATYAKRGDLLAWGANDYGQATPPATASNVIQTAAGLYNSAVLRADGSVVVWGSNGNGQCNVPSDLSNAVAIALGDYHALALRASGTVSAWGYNGYGQCNVPEGLLDIVAIAASTYNSAALKSDGTLAVWGYTGYGVCTLPDGLSNVVAVALGKYHALALRADGTVAAWGNNGNGQCNVPESLSNAVAVSAGAYHSVALLADGTVVAWGYNSNGQCDIPAGLARVIAIAAGDSHTAALCADGTVAAWGATSEGQCDIPSALPRTAVLTAGGNHTILTFGPCSPVTFSPPSGMLVPGSGYPFPVRLLGATLGGGFRYTLDGAAPAAASTLYTEPPQLGDDTTVRAALFVDGQQTGESATARYPLLPGGVVFHTVTTEASPPEAGTASGGGTVRKNAAATVTATVTQTAKYVFGRWLCNGTPASTLPVYTFTVTANCMLTAVFDLATYSVKAEIEPSGLGWVYGTGWWRYGETNTLTAYPYGGCRFAGWYDTASGDLLGTDLAYALAVTNSLTVRARFEETVSSHTVTTRTEPAGLFALGEAGTYTNGALVAFEVPHAVTNGSLRQVFQYFTLNGNWATSSDPWNWRLSRADPPSADVCAVYTEQPLAPKVRLVSRSLDTPVPITDALQANVVFDRSMNTSVLPSVIVSNVSGTVVRTLLPTNSWTGRYVQNDTYRCPTFGFARGEDGDYVMTVAGACDTYGGVLATTNVWSFRVDATPPTPPTLRLTNSNDTWFTVGWADYAPPSDLNGFRVYVSESVFSTLSGLSPVSYLWSGTRAYTRYGIQLDTTYWIAIVPMDQAGNMETAVTPLAVRIPRALPPAVPFTVTATGPDAARLDWPTYAGDSLGFAEFRIYRDTQPFSTVSNRTPVATLGKYVRTYAASGLDRTATNWFSVVGFNSRGESIDRIESLPWADPYRGVITNDVTIGRDGEITEILDAITVRAGAVVTVPAGATLAFRRGAGITVEEGAIVANGSALKPVRFTSAETNAPAAGDWSGIVLLAQAGSSLFRHAWFEYGRGLTVEGCAPMVDACTARYNAPAGFDVRAGGALATRDALLLYNAAGVRAASGASVALARSIIRNNVTNALAEAGAALTATNVWWGSAEAATLGAGLSGDVFCEPFLTSEPVLTPAADAADGNRNVGEASIVLALAGRVAEAVQISEDSLFTGSFFDAFESRKTVALSAGGGTKTLYVRFRNASGQISETVTVPINYITGGPQITGCNLAEGATLTRPFVLTASAWSGLGVATLRVLADDSVVASTNAAALSARWDIRSLTPGTHRIRVEALDARGNLGTRAFNVTANIQPPPNPVLSEPADGLLTTEAAVAVAGTAEPFSSVSLRRNGASVQQATTAADGRFAATVTLLEGENTLVATLTDAYGTGRSNERHVTRDSGAPEPVALQTAVYTPGTGVQIGWIFAADGEKPSSIRLLRSESPFTTADEATWQGAWTTDNPLTTVPPSDGRWYFAAEGRDAADNRSALSNVLTNDYDGTAPSFALSFDKATPCGTGLLHMEITASETLTNLPTVTVQPPAASGPTMVTVSNVAPNRYTCAYNVQSVAGSGILAVRVSGTDLAGNRAIAVAPSGTPMVLDTRAPEGVLTLNPSGLVQVTNPVPLMVSLRLDEQPAAVPALRFTPPEGATLPVSLTGGGTNWTGQVELLPTMGSGFGTFAMTVSDALANTGTSLGGTTQVELYNTADPEPPARVTDLRASTDQQAGVVKLVWLAVSDAESYSLYRQAGASGTTPDGLVADGLTGTAFSDLPAEDGFYRYVVRSVRRGVAAQPSPEALGLSDRTPPPAPQNLTASLASDGVRVEWEYAASGEQPEYFRVYRNGELWRDRLSPATRFVLDNPAAGTWTYAAASVDRCGNEALSASASLDLTLPAVVRTDVTVGTDLIPRLTWQTRPEHVGVNLYRNGVKLNATPLTDPSFSDSGLTGSGVTRYEVRGVNAAGDESAARQLPVYRLAFGFNVNADVGGYALLRYFDRATLIVSNRTADAGFETSSLTLTRSIDGGASLTRTVSTDASAASGAAVSINATLPCATALGAQSYAVVLTQALDDSSASVRYAAAFTGRKPSLPSAQIDVSLDTQPVAGAACTPRARIYNRSQVPVDIVMWRNGEAGDLAVHVLDAHDAEVNRVDVMMPKASLIATPNGLRGFLRIQPQDSVLITLPEIIVPEALGADTSAAVTVDIAHLYYACGETGEEISGPLEGRRTITPTPTPYTAVGYPERAAYLAGETMVVTGYAFDRLTLDRMTNVTVNVGISLNGTAWYTTGQTDSEGNFRAEWPIVDGISGLCQVWASHPQVKDHLDQGQTAVYQAYFRPREGDLRMAANDLLTVRLSAYNPGSFTFTNLTSSFTAWRVSGGVTNFLPLNVVSGAVSAVESLALPPRQLVSVTLTLSAAEEAIPSFSCRFEIVTPEGLRIPFDADVSVTAPLPLITVATPSSGYVDMSLDRGKTRSADVELRNDGFKALRGVRMTAPTISWMQVALTPGTNGLYALPDLEPGQSHTFQVLYAPSDDVEMKYYSDTLSITGTNTVTVKSLNLYAKITSAQSGCLHVHVENNLGLVVPDASVRVRSALDGTERTGFKTDENGDIDIPDLMEGDWHWQVSSSGHATQAGTAKVEADVTTELSTVLTRELVTVTFSVVPVPFTDRYEIKIEQTFSTYVPAPVLVADPVFKDYGTVTGPFTDTYTVTAKNYGLIKLTDFTVKGSRASWGSLVPAISYLPQLDPMQQVEIPFTMTFSGDNTESEATPASAPAALGNTLAKNTLSATDISDAASTLGDIRDTFNDLNDTESEDDNPDPPQYDPCRDDFFKAVKQMMAYLNGQYHCMSSSDLYGAQVTLNAVVKLADSDSVPIGIGTLMKMYQAIFCIADALGSTSKGTQSSGGGGGGGGNGYGGGGGGCFAAGTTVLMADGTLRAIETVKPGDTVQTGPRTRDVASVRAAYRRSDVRIRVLTLANGTRLETTDEHRIWVDTCGWKLAKDIRPGESVATTRDVMVAVRANTATDRVETVYTLDLKEDTAFYANGVLVQHLCGRALPGLTPASGPTDAKNGGAK